MEVLDDRILERLEMYQIMATIFFRRLNSNEKTEALLEALETIKGENLDV